MKKLLGIFAMVGALSLVGCGGDAEVCNGGADEDEDGQIDCDDADCVADPLCDVGGVCGDGLVDAGEDCDGANLAGQDCLTAGGGDGGTLACAADCTFDTTACTITNGNGIRFPGAEQCDDGNATAGDGCDAAGNLEDTTTVTVNANAAGLNNTTAAAATKSIFVPIAPVDGDGDGVDDTDWLLIVSTDRGTICDDILDMGGLGALLDFGGGPVFTGQLDGTFVFTNLGVPVGTLAAGTFTGDGGHLVTLGPDAYIAGSTSVDIGFVFNSGGIQNDTTYGSSGNGTFTVESFAFDGATGAGNLAAVSGNDVLMDTQFIGAGAGTISEPISIDINGAVSCAADF
jgi:cysteine-rich repeat protein